EGGGGAKGGGREKGGRGGSKRRKRGGAAGPPAPAKKTTPATAAAARCRACLSRSRPETWPAGRRKQETTKRNATATAAIILANKHQRLRNVKTPESLLFRREIVGRFCGTPTIGFNLK